MFKYISWVSLLKYVHIYNYTQTHTHTHTHTHTCTRTHTYTHICTIVHTIKTCSLIRNIQIVYICTHLDIIIHMTYVCLWCVGNGLHAIKLSMFYMQFNFNKYFCSPIYMQFNFNVFFSKHYIRSFKNPEFWL